MSETRAKQGECLRPLSASGRGLGEAPSDPTPQPPPRRGEGAQAGDSPKPWLLKSVLLLLIGLTATTHTFAQGPTEGPQLARARGNAGKRLAEVEALLAEGKPQAAADGLRKLLAEAGDDLVSVDGRRFVTVRSASRGVLARLPEGERRAWRERSDAPAAERFGRAAKLRDPARLEAVADDYPLSASAGPALELLGELALARGEFRAAETYWKRASVVPPAFAAARSAVVARLQGDTARAASLGAELRQKFPGVTGSLAGRTGNLAETAEQLIAAPPVVPPPAGGDGEWTAFAGNSARTGHAARPLARYWPSRPSWVLPLAGRVEVAPPNGLAPARSLPRHPVALGTTGYVADSRSVVAFDLMTGEPRDSYSFPMAANQFKSDADAPLTAVPGRDLVFARLGPADIAPPPANERAVLACFRAGVGKLELAYSLNPPVPEGVAAAWEAAPAWRDGKIYAAFVREAGNRLVTAVACYTDSGGEPLWVADVAEAGVGGRAERRTRPEPITLGGGRVIYCTQAGFVVALHESDGKPAWAHAYPPAPRSTPEFRALAPAIFEGGRVFVAPTDADRVLALDAVNGELIWEAEGTQTEQFLGVSGGHLVASVAAPVRGLRGYDLATGSTRAPGGWAIHDDPQLAGYGRGLVAGGAALWPTRSGVFFVRPGDGLPLAARLNGPHGNLAFAGGVLLVATPTEVWGYVRDPGIPTFAEPPRHLPAQSIADLLAALPKGGGAERLEVFRRDLLRTESLATEVVRGPNGVPARLGTLAARHFLPAAPPKPPRRPREPPDDSPRPPTQLGSDARVVESLPLPSRGCIPLLPFTGENGLPGLAGGEPILLVADAHTVHALTPRQSKPRWARELPLGSRFTRATVEAGRVTLAGPRGFASLARSSGRVEWVYRHPDELPDLAEPQLAGELLTARVGVAQRISLDARTGEILWGRDEFGHDRLGADPPAADAFASPLTAVGGGWVGQVAAGKRDFLSAATGQRLSTAETYPNPWPSPAARLAPDRVAFAEGPGLVRALDCGDQLRPAWAWRAGGEASLTGRMPHLRATIAGLFVAIERNHAIELALLSPNGGTPLWPRTAYLPPGVPDLAALVEDRDRGYVIVGDTLHALGLRTGRAEWSADLPALLGVPAGSRYTVDAGPRGVIVAAPHPGDDPPAMRTLVVALLTNRFPATAVAQLDAISTRGVGIATLDPTTGRRAGLLRIEGGPAAWHLAGPNPVAVTPGVAHWLR